MSVTRLELMQQWVAAQLTEPFELDMLPGDASFRRYARIQTPTKTYVLMDAPPSHEDVKPFIQVTEILEEQGAHVPHIYAQNVQDGFLLLEDFGSTLLSQVLNENNVNDLYGVALKQMLDFQAPIKTKAQDLPIYSAAKLQQEMALLNEWFVPHLLNLTIEPAEQAILDKAYHFIIDTVQTQSQVIVHRDYHCRNLMVLAKVSNGQAASDKPLGIIDYQDAVIGPLTYDAASLLRDAYVQWPASQVQTWVKNLYAQWQQSALVPAEQNFETLWQGFNVMSLQRHLKILGIFVRLYKRDGKAGYLDNIPLVLDYTLEELSQIPNLVDLFNLFKNKWLPAYLQVNPYAKPQLSRWLV